MPVYPGASIQQQRDHHARIVRRTPDTITAIRAVERRQIHLLDRGEHKPRQVILRQPVLQARRHQQHLPAITTDEVLRHTTIVLSMPDATNRDYATATAQGSPLPAPARGCSLSSAAVACEQ
jgi:hypothetical protein